MLIEHRGHRPEVHPDAYVAPTAVLCGDVTVAAGARILFGAVLTGEDGSIAIGERTVVMENALVRGRQRHPVTIGTDVMIGPHTHLNGTTIEDGAFIATQASLFPGSRVGAGAQVRIGGVVHVNTVVPEGLVVPIGWVAVGDPAEFLSPDEHERIWEIQQTLDFPGTVYGLESMADPRERMQAQSRWFGAHRDDRAVDG